jgi:hypothetical protein
MRAVVVSVLLVATPAFAGLGSLLAKLGKAGSSAGKVAKVGGKVAKVAKVAKVGAGVAGVSSAFAAERAGFALGGLSDDAARTAAFVARGAEGEVMLVTRAGGQSVHSPSGAGAMVDAMAVDGAAPTVFLDASAASSTEVVAALPPRARLVLVEEGRTMPLARKSGGELGELVVDQAGNLVDLGDYLGVPSGEVEDEEGGFGGVLTVLVVLAFIGGGLLWLLGRRTEPTAPA